MSTTTNIKLQACVILLIVILSLILTSCSYREQDATGKVTTDVKNLGSKAYVGTTLNWKLSDGDTITDKIVAQKGFVTVHLSSYFANEHLQEKTYTVHYRGVYFNGLLDYGFSETPDDPEDFNEDGDFERVFPSPSGFLAKLEAEMKSGNGNTKAQLLSAFDEMLADPTPGKQLSYQWVGRNQTMTVLPPELLDLKFDEQGPIEAIVLEAKTDLGNNNYQIEKYWFDQDLNYVQSSYALGERQPSIKVLSQYSE